jgi:hypothetical protein
VGKLDWKILVLMTIMLAPICLVLKEPTVQASSSGGDCPMFSL